MLCDPWMCIASLYALQALGSVVVTRLFGMSYSETAVPIGLLVLGSIAALVFGWRKRSRRAGGSWQAWLSAGIYAAFIFSLSHHSFSDATPLVDTNLFHPVEYATLGFLFCWAWLPVLQKRGKVLFIAAVLSTGVLYGISDELHQAFIPGRTPSVIDLGLDVVGLSLGYGLFAAGGYLFQRFRAKPESGE